MRRALAALAAFALLAGTAAASPWDDSARAAAIMRWGNVCDGQVYLTSARLPKTVNAMAYAFREEDGTFTNCKVVYNSRYVGGMTYEQFCTIMVHEYGHLAGRGHSPNPNSVMYAYRLKTWPGCKSR